MRILVNGLSARVGGGRTVLRSHIDALRASAGANELVVLTTAPDLLDDLAGVSKLLVWPQVPAALRIVLEQLAVPALALRYRSEAIYCVGNVGLLLPVRPVVQLLQSAHHFSTLAPPERSTLYSGPRRLRYRLEAALARVTARRSARVCTVSQSLAGAVRAEWSEVADRLRVLASPMPDDPPAADLGVQPPPYCLFVANDYPHKHWTEVIEVFRARPELPPLVVVGQPRPERRIETAAIEQLEADLGGQRTVFLGPIVDRSQLVWLYENAATVLVHSTSETFGLTLVEALVHNGAVAAADLPAHREVGAHEEVRFYDPVATDDMADALIEVMVKRRSPVPAQQWPTTVDLSASLTHVLETVGAPATAGQR